MHLHPRLKRRYVMWFDGIRQPNTIYVANVSRGKDSTAMLEAIKLLGWPLDMICSVDIWFDADTPAELPPMVAFKADWDAKCFDIFGVPVTRLCAQKGDKKLTYVEQFYSFSPKNARTRMHGINGFPIVKGNWCNSSLKVAPLNRRSISRYCQIDGQKINIVHYIGIAVDEPLRIFRHMPKKDMVMPLVQIGWEEDLCGLIATYLDMLAPTYTTCFRDGCWFCHNQGVEQLRSLRHNYPNLWAKLLHLDSDSPMSFHPDGHTVHDFDRRFQLEDEGLIDPIMPFRWSMLDAELNYIIF